MPGTPYAVTDSELREIELARPKKEVENPEPPTRKIGFGGLRAFNGIVSEEYLQVLRGTKKIDTYTRMLSDGTVEGMLQAIKTLYLDAKWTVVPGGKEPRALRAAERVQRQLGVPPEGDAPEGVLEGWQDTLESMLTMLDFGFQVLVENWREGRRGEDDVVLDELLQVHPRTILQGSRQWDFNDRGKLLGFWQSGYTGSKWITNDYIPITRCLHLVHGRRFGDPEGRAVLRSPYKHWLIMDNLYRFDGIGIQRASSGVPIGTYPAGIATTERDEFEEGLKHFQIGDSGYLMIPEGYSVDAFKLDYRSEVVLNSIEHHRHQIVMCILAEWMLLGQGKRGSGGGKGDLSGDQIDMFTRFASQQASKLASRITLGTARKIVYYNDPGLERRLYPKIEVNVTRLSAFGFADALRKLMGPDQPLIKWMADKESNADQVALREILNLSQVPAGMDPTPPEPILPGPAGGENGRGTQPNNPESGETGRVKSDSD